MKLKLRTRSTETLRSTLSLISPLRKYVVLRFTPSQLLVILVDGSAVVQEPQVWCKLPLAGLFDLVEILSLREDTILLEINVELLLQTLRNFDRANSDGLNIRLQRKDSSGANGSSTSSGRTASLALYYASVNANTNTINHTFRIPVKILKNLQDALHLREPEIADVDLMVKLPSEFSATYRRLEKFKKASSNDLVTIRASRRRGGFLGFVLEEEGKYNVTIGWNDKLEVRRARNQEGLLPQAQDGVVDEEDESEDKEITVKLRDWKMALKIVATCKTVILLLTHQEACVLHCLLDEQDEVEVIYYISAVREGEI